MVYMPSFSCESDQVRFAENREDIVKIFIYNGGDRLSTARRLISVCYSWSLYVFKARSSLVSSVGSHHKM